MPLKWWNHEHWQYILHGHKRSDPAAGLQIACRLKPQIFFLEKYTSGSFTGRSLRWILEPSRYIPNAIHKTSSSLPVCACCWRWSSATGQRTHSQVREEAHRSQNASLNCSFVIQFQSNPLGCTACWSKNIESHRYLLKGWPLELPSTAPPEFWCQ